MVFFFSLLDNEAPSVTCPNDVPSIYVDSGTAMSTVTWSTSPSASDIVDGDITAKVVCKDNKGNVVITDGTYAVGLTTVMLNWHFPSFSAVSLALDYKVVGAVCMGFIK